MKMKEDLEWIVIEEGEMKEEEEEEMNIEETNIHKINIDFFISIFV